MSPEIAVLARHRVARAREALGECDALQAAGAFRGAVSRFYDYADFSDVTPEEASRVRTEVAQFVDACADLLERLLQTM